MCGIVGYIGNRNSQEILIEGLKKLEYRGYDSAGVAVFTENGLQVKKGGVPFKRNGRNWTYSLGDTW
jgi:glucosamine 6-phosphate synthetase-like amidotransferase/phosphosugar isomerase protein